MPQAARNLRIGTNTWSNSFPQPCIPSLLETLFTCFVLYTLLLRIAKSTAKNDFSIEEAVPARFVSGVAFVQHGVCREIAGNSRSREQESLYRPSERIAHTERTTQPTARCQKPTSSSTSSSLKSPRRLFSCKARSPPTDLDEKLLYLLTTLKATKSSSSGSEAASGPKKPGLLSPTPIWPKQC